MLSSIVSNVLVPTYLRCKSQNLSRGDDIAIETVEKAEIVQRCRLLIVQFEGFTFGRIKWTIVRWRVYRIKWYYGRYMIDNYN